MFVLKQSPTYTWPVEFLMPAGEGKFNQCSFTAEFKRLPQSRLQTISTDEKITDTDFVSEFFVGFSEIKDGDGNELQATEQNLKTVIDVPGLVGALIVAYKQSIYGLKRKNS